MKIISLLFLCFLTSCAVYRQRFDCPPDPGVPCTSVTDLEQMIVETGKGPDMFINSAPQCKGGKRKIWINTYRSPNGKCIPGHYIYVN